MATSEQVTTSKVLVEASLCGARVFRNNSGAAKTDGGRYVYFGLGNDGSKASKNLKFGDYVGYRTVTITPDMVGKKIAQFVNIEIKPEGTIGNFNNRASRQGTRENLQWNTCKMVELCGGVAGVVSSAHETRELLKW